MKRLFLAIAALFAVAHLALGQGIVTHQSPQFDGLGVGAPATGNGNVNATGQYQVQGRQLAVGNLAPIPAGHVVANPTGGTAPPADASAPTWFDQAFCSTVGYVLARTAGTWACSQGIPINVAWFGVIGDGKTDNSPALQGLVDQVIATNNGGTLYFPPGNYCLFSGVVVTQASTIDDVHFVGTGVYPTALNACGHNTTVVWLGTQWSGIRDLAVYGYGALPTDTAVFTGTPPTAPALVLAPACSQCTLRDLYVTGGTAAIQIQASGYILDNVWASFSYGDGAHAMGFVYTINGGGSINNSHFDMVYPVGQPAYGTAITAWVPNQVYGLVGTIVSVTCNARSWWIQLKATGTSGASQPGCKPYGASIPDGSATWMLVNAAQSYGLQIDTGSVEVEVSQTDLTCACNYNLGITNTFAGVAPQQIDLTTITPGGGMSGNVTVAAGGNIRLVNVETNLCVLSGCVAVGQSSGGSGFSYIGTQCVQSSGYCIALMGGTSTGVLGTFASGSHVTGIQVNPGVSYFALTGNVIVAAAGSALIVYTGASNHYTVQGNECGGGGYSDGGTGVIKLVQASCP